jgi:phosphate ABC transporter phosphate-binding protein
MRRIIDGVVGSFIVALLTLPAFITTTATPARAAGPTILGAGSTWSAIAINQWQADVNRLGLSVNYQSVGSTSGRQFFASNTVDFGVSEIPFQSDDPQVKRKYAYLPIVAGGTAMMYNLKDAGGNQIRDLKLSSGTIAAIFTGKITNWNDARIRADYGKTIPSQAIKAIVRSDGSGTSAQFSAYLKAMQPGAWGSFTSSCGVPNQATSFWPYGRPNCLQNGIAQKGSDGVANYIANQGLGVGAIGYLEAGYAVARKFPVVGVKNRSGTFTIPTAGNVAIALRHAKLNSDSTQDLSQVYTAPEKDAYPISSYSYMIVPTDSSISNDKGAVLGKFIIYFACKGQQAAQRLGYSPMPKELVEFAFAAERKIPGAPDPPAVNGQECPNPTLTGDFKGGGVLPGTDLSGNGNIDGGDTSVPDPNDPRNRQSGNGDGSRVDENGNPIGPGEEGSATDGSGKGGDGKDGGSGTGGSDGVRYTTDEPAVLSNAQLLSRQLAASELIDGLRPTSNLPLLVLATIILALVFGPVFLRMRSR